MTRRLFGFFIAFLLVGGGMWGLSAGLAVGDPSDKPPTSDAPSEDPTDEPEDGDPNACKPYRVLGDFLYEQGFEKSDFISVWKPSNLDLIDWSDSSGHVEDPFSDEPITSFGELTSFLGGDSPASVAARDIMDGEADTYGAVQFKVPIKYSGNWFWDDGQSEQGGDNLKAPAGDVWWIAISDCEVEGGLSIRAICGNVGFDSLEPARRE